VNPWPLVICLACTAPTLCCQLLSPASGAHLGRAHSVADVHVIAHSVLVVGYPKLPAFDSTGAGTVVRLARGNQCSCTSGRMITACALHSVMCCTTCSTVTGGGKQYPRGTVFPPGVTATFWLKRKGKSLPPPTLHSGTPIFSASPPRCYALTLGPGTGWCSNRTRCRGTVVSSTTSGRTWCPTGSSRKNKIKTKHKKIRDKYSHVKGLWRTTFSLVRAPERGGLVSVPGVVDIGEGRNTA